MAFATRCPQCSTVFQTTGEQLAQCAGMVRCGVCKASFNGIERLIGRISPGQEIPAGMQPPAAQPVPASQETAPLQEPVSLPEPSQPPAAPAVEAASAVASSEPVDSGEPLPLTDAEKSLQEAFDRQLQSFSLEIAPSSNEPVIEDAPAASPAPETADAEKTEPVLTDGAPVDPPQEAPLPAPAKKQTFSGVLLWAFIIVVLLLAAGLVGIYYYGKEIVEEVPALEETVDTVCEQLSCPAEPPPATPPVTAGSDLTLTYEAPAKDPVIPDSFNQKLSLANTGRQKQPWPELRLEITDAKGTLLSERSLKPKDYLSEALSKTDSIEPATKHDLTLHFELKHPPAAVNSRVTLSNPPTPTH